MGACNPDKGKLGLRLGQAPTAALGGIQGVDVSNNNGTISGRYLVQHGIRFLYVKAEENCRTDSQLAHNISEAVRNHLPVGLYVFFRPAFPASSTASCLAALTRYAADHGATLLPDIFDVESFSEGPVCNALNAAIFDLRRDYAGVKIGRYGSSGNSPNCGSNGVYSWPADWLVSFPQNLPGFSSSALFNWQWFGPRFASTTLDGMDRDKGSPGIFSLEFHKPAPSKGELKEQLVRLYHARRGETARIVQLDRLRNAHRCARPPVIPNGHYVHACHEWRKHRLASIRELNKIGREITALHRKGIR